MQRVVCSLYEQSRKIVLKEIENEQINPRQDEDRPSIDFVRSYEVYLTKEEAKEFAKMIKRFTQKRTKEEQEKRQKYHFFAVLRPLHDEKEE